MFRHINLPPVLALVIVLGLLPLTAFAEDSAPAAAPAKVVNYGFVWDASSLSANSTIEGTGAKVGSDWINETMYIVTNKPTGAGTYMWVKVTVAGEEWGCYAGGSADATTYAFSFLNRAGQWEQMPNSLKSETANATKCLENKITGENCSLSMKLEVYSSVTYDAGNAPTLPSKADFTRTITLEKNEEIKCYNGYPVSEWITDMTSALSGLSTANALTGTEGNQVLTLTDELTRKTSPVGAFLNVWANKDVLEVPQQLLNNDQKTTIEGYKTTLQGIKKIDASGLTDNKLTGLGTLAPYTGLEELNFSGNAVADGTNGAAEVLDGDEIGVWKSTLKSLNLSNTNVSDINALAGSVSGGSYPNAFTALETLDISEAKVANLNVLEHLTGLKSLTATKLQNVNLLGLAALVNKEGFSESNLTVNLGTGGGASTLDSSLSDAEKLAVNAALGKLGDSYTGPKYDIEGDTPEIAVAAANLTYVDGQSAPAYSWADTYAVTETGGTITVSATGLKKHENASGTEGYWVGVALTKLDSATYEWGFKDGDTSGEKSLEYFADGRTQTVNGADGVTLYWDIDGNDKDGFVKVKVGGTTVEYTVKFEVTAAADEPVVTDKDIDVTYTNFSAPRNHLAGGYFTIANDGASNIQTGDKYLVQLVHNGVASIFVVTAADNKLEFLCNCLEGDALGVWKLADDVDIKTATVNSISGNNACYVWEKSLDIDFFVSEQ